MKIAQIAPIAESVPPQLYGGTERIVCYLTEELVRQGHEVTLFASGDSRTTAKLVPVCDKALRLNALIRDPIPHQMILLDEVRERAAEFDVLHFHIDLLQAPLVREFVNRTVTTLHGRLDLPDLQPFYRRFADMPLVSISNDQRRPMPPVNWVGTVYHGLPRDLLPANLKPKGGLPRVPGPHLARKASGSRDRDRGQGGRQAQDRRQGRRGRQGLLERGHRADDCGEP